MHHINPFSIARLPRIEFGSGVLKKVPQLAAGYGKHALVLTGHKSFVDTQHWADLKTAFDQSGTAVTHIKRNAGEPSPSEVDNKVAALAGQNINVVIGIGGGSVLDEAKAIAGLLRVGHSVMDYLEGVGPERSYEGPSVPFIAVPTTAGTGSEATKNAVLSQHGTKGFKKSFRDDKLVAEWAVVDPDLIATCPQTVIAGNGMDAFTQLLESYVSTKANPITDALALQGLKAAFDGLLPLYESAGADPQARTNMALASLLSGINLAQTGLGSVHGLASPLGAFFPIPHGIVCGTLMGAATRINIEALKKHGDRASPALAKYAEIGRMLSQSPTADDATALFNLVETIDDWTKRLDLPRLQAFGIEESDFSRIIKNISPSSMKTNPLVLEENEIVALLMQRL